MKNFIQPGENMTFPAPAGGTVSGNGYLIGSLFVVASNTAAEGEDVAFSTCGVYDLTKNAAEAWTRGQKVYWDNGNSRCTTTVGSNTLIGSAAAVAANPSSTGIVRLNGTVA